MRINVPLDAGLHRRLRLHTAARGQTLQGWTVAAITAHLDATADSPQAIRLLADGPSSSLHTKISPELQARIRAIRFTQDLVAADWIPAVLLAALEAEEAEEAARPPAPSATTPGQLSLPAGLAGGWGPGDFPDVLLASAENVAWVLQDPLLAQDLAKAFRDALVRRAQEALRANGRQAQPPA